MPGPAHIALGRHPLTCREDILEEGAETDHSMTPSRPPRIRELVWYYLRLGTLGFGGPVALCGQMERELVGERQWLSKEEMRDGIAVHSWFWTCTSTRIASTTARYVDPLFQNINWDEVNHRLERAHKAAAALRA